MPNCNFNKAAKQLSTLLKSQFSMGVALQLY